MSVLMPVRTPDLKRMKRGGKNFTMTRLLDRSGVDVLLVGDAIALVMMEQKNTLQVTMDGVVHRTAAVAHGTE